MPENEAPSPTPIVLDLGKVKGKRIKELKEGRGPLLDEVHAAVTSVHGELGDQAGGVELVPVVLLYERKRKKKRRGIFVF